MPQPSTKLVAGQALVTDLGQIPLAGVSGVLWGLDSPQLNVNLVKIGADDRIDPHVNDAVDVLLIVQSGRGEVTIDEVAHPIKADSVLLIPLGARRSVEARTQLVYYSIHARRPGLGIASNRTA